MTDTPESDQFPPGSSGVPQIVCPKCKTPSEMSEKAVCPNCGVKRYPTIWVDTPGAFVARQIKLRHRVGQPTPEPIERDQLRRWAESRDPKKLAHTPKPASGLPPVVDMNSQQAATNSDRYPALRTLSGIYSFLGGLIAFVGVLAVAATAYLLFVEDIATEWSGVAQVAALVVVALIFGLGALLYISLAEVIKLGVDLEANTRRTSNLMARLHVTLTKKSTDQQD